MKTDDSPVNWDIKSLRIFLLVARVGNLTKAGVELGMSQSAVSRYLSTLEKKSGGYLFQRHGRGVSLSELGQRIYPIVERVMEDLGNLTGIVSEEAQRLGGLVRIGTLPSLSRDIFVPLFFLLQKEYPGIRLKIQEGSGGQIDSWLLTQQIDIGLPYRNNNESQYADESIIQMQSYLVGPLGDKLTRGSTVPFRKMHQIPLILPSKPSAVRMKLDELARKEKIHLNVVIDADSGLMQKCITEQHGGYTVLPWHAIKEEVENKQIQAARIIEPEIARNISIVVNNNPSKATRKVSRIIRSLFENSRIHQ
ncbi:hypothetical protein W822_11575 [Advenella kashmirensis W13003]|uniref:HTH lysR-type domain-containing protein n=1 Tax=Advenella kashmirensis W13003 TaxID=1424334 RepID=V8QW20_9BURK|nr:LysR family transcriptional regulator [Advenella kashmirensis]ETF03528.1 hypothetical protein W822_11575 [Advenella kashmirensis W13003]